MSGRKITIVLFLMVALVVLGVWWNTKDGPDYPTVVAPSPSAQPEPSASDSFPAGTSPATETVPAAPPANRQPAIAAWERQIDQVLETEAPPSNLAQILINMIPSLPEEGQEAAAQHVSNLLADEDYKVVLPLLINPSTAEPVLDVLATDLMNREDPVKLRTWLAMARVQNHPFREEALGNLEIYLDHDHGTDWPKWQAAVEEYLAAHPEEPMEEAEMTLSPP